MSSEPTTEILEIEHEATIVLGAVSQLAPEAAWRAAYDQRAIELAAAAFAREGLNAGHIVSMAIRQVPVRIAGAADALHWAAEFKARGRPALSDATRGQLADIARKLQPPAGDR